MDQEKTVATMMRAPASARRTYDRLARWYGWLSRSEAPFRIRAVEMLGVQPGERVLEIGPGIGACLSALEQAGAAAVGLDLSYQMCRVSQSRLRGEGRGARIAQGDGLALPFAESTFDALLMIFTLELFDPRNMPLALAACRRVLRPGGRLCAASLARSVSPGMAERVYGWFHQSFPTLVDCRPIALEDLLEAAGLSVMEEWHGAMWGLPVSIACAGNHGEENPPINADGDK